MATSGTETFMLNSNDIVTQALKRLGVVTFGNAPRIEDMVTATTELNVMVKNWRADGVQLWKTQWASIPLTPSDYVVGSDGNAYECIRSHTSDSTTKPITGAEYLSYWIRRYTAWVTATDYSVGALVVGSNGLLYSCILAHTSAAATKPVTGATYATYWDLYTTVYPGTWATATDYYSICNPQLKTITTTPQSINYKAALLYAMENDTTRTDSNVSTVNETINLRTAGSHFYDSSLSANSVLTTTGIAGQDIVINFWASKIGSLSSRTYLSSTSLTLLSGTDPLRVLQGSAGVYNYKDYGWSLLAPFTMHHYVIILSGSTGTIDLYRDGVLLTETVDATGIIPAFNFTPITLGGLTSNGASFFDFAIFDYAALLAAGETNATIASTLYSNTFKNNGYEFCYEFASDVVVTNNVIDANKRILGIGNAFMRNDQSQDSYVNSHLQAYEYFRMGNKTNQGRPTMLYFKRNPDVDEFFLYPYPDTNTWVLNIELYYYPDDFTDPTDSPDFLMEWEAALIDGLTVRLYSLFPGRSRVSLNELLAIFQDSYGRAKSGDSEKGELQCVPDFWLNNGRY